MRRAGNRVRVNAQLANAASGTHLWADCYDCLLEDIFDLQDRVTASVVGAIAPKLQQSEIERAKRKPTHSLDAYDHYLRGLAYLHRRTTEAVYGAQQEFSRAIELDAEYAAAHAMLSYCHVLRKRDGLTANRKLDLAECERAARRAAQLGRDDAVSLCWAGFALAYVAHDVAAGSELIARGLTFNPNLAAAWVFSGWVHIYQGEFDVAIEHLSHAMRLSPADPFPQIVRAATAFAHLLAHRYGEACLWAERALQEDPTHSAALRYSAAAHALAGRLDQARRPLNVMLSINPALRLSDVKELAPLQSDDLATFVEGLRKAGLPE